VKEIDPLNSAPYKTRAAPHPYFYEESQNFDNKNNFKQNLFFFLQKSFEILKIIWPSIYRIINSVIYYLLKVIKATVRFILIQIGIIKN